MEMTLSFNKMVLPHMALMRLVSSLRKEEKVELLDWPPQSPDRPKPCRTNLEIDGNCIQDRVVLEYP